MPFSSRGPLKNFLDEGIGYIKPNFLVVGNKLKGSAIDPKECVA